MENIGGKKNHDTSEQDGEDASPAGELRKAILGALISKVDDTDKKRAK